MWQMKEAVIVAVGDARRVTVMGEENRGSANGIDKTEGW